MLVALLTSINRWYLHHPVQSSQLNCALCGEPPQFCILADLLRLVLLVVVEDGEEVFSLLAFFVLFVNVQASVTHSVSHLCLDCRVFACFIIPHFKALVYLLQFLSLLSVPSLSTLAVFLCPLSLFFRAADDSTV